MMESKCHSHRNGDSFIFFIYCMLCSPFHPWSSSYSSKCFRSSFCLPTLAERLRDLQNEFLRGSWYPCKGYSLGKLFIAIFLLSSVREPSRRVFYIIKTHGCENKPEERICFAYSLYFFLLKMMGWIVLQSILEQLNKKWGLKCFLKNYFFPLPQ